MSPAAVAAPPQEIQVLDTGILEDTRGIIGNDAMVKIIASALESLRESVSEINVAVQMDDSRQIKRIAHKIKGTAAQLGAARANVVAHSIETQAVDDVASAVHLLNDAVSQSAHMLEVYARTLKETSPVTAS